MRRIVRVAGIAAILLLALGWLGALHPAFDSIGHFRVHMLVGAAFVFLILLALRAWGITFALVAAAAVSVALMHPALPGLAPEGGSADFTVAQQNLLYINVLPEQAAAVLERSGADVLLLQEVTGPNDGILARLLAAYPAQTVCPFRNLRAVAIVSRRPFAAAPSCLEGHGLVTAPVAVGGRTVTFASLHASWPWPRDQWSNLPALEPRLRALGGPLVLGGDFNATPWSAFVRRVADAADAQIVSGFRFTFNLLVLPQGDTRFGGLPIDHVLHSPDLVPSGADLLPHAGSDHLGTLVGFRFVP